MSKLTEWIFPFNTCEIPQKDALIAQPWSFGINILASCCLLYYSTKSVYLHTKLTILSYFFFEFAHSIYHAVHFNKAIQTNSIHVLFYIICFRTFITYRNFTKINLNWYQTVGLFFIILTDLYMFFYIGGFWVVFSGISILFYITSMYYYEFPQIYIRKYKSFIIGTVLLISFLANEILHCEYMLNFAQLPYHILIEITGVYLYINLSVSLLEWEYHHIKQKRN